MLWGDLALFSFGKTGPKPLYKYTSFGADLKLQTEY